MIVAEGWGYNCNKWTKAIKLDCTTRAKKNVVYLNGQTIIEALSSIDES